MIAGRSGTLFIEPGNRENEKGTEATKRRQNVSANYLRRPPVAGLLRLFG
jgi:hypothetical protein